MMEIKQYHIVKVNLEQTIEGEVLNAGLFIVLSPDELNRNLNHVVVAPFTLATGIYPTRVKIRKGKLTGRAVLEQLMTLDINRVMEDMGSLSKTEITMVKAVLRETYVD